MAGWQGWTSSALRPRVLREARHITPKKMLIEFEDPHILICEKGLSGDAGVAPSDSDEL